jgi:hypothetical protein
LSSIAITSEYRQKAGGRWFFQSAATHLVLEPKVFALIFRIPASAVQFLASKLVRKLA